MIETKSVLQQTSRTQAMVYLFISINQSIFELKKSFNDCNTKIIITAIEGLIIVIVMAFFVSDLLITEIM